MDAFKIWEKAKQDVSHWHHHYDELARVMAPRRLGFASEQVEGASRTDTLFDGTPMQAARGLTNTIDGLLWPDGELNYRIRTEDNLENSDEVKEWLFEAAEANHEEMIRPQSRFRQARGEKTLDLVVFGTGCMFIGESRNKDSLRFQAMHLKNCTPIFDVDGTPIGNCVEDKFAIRDLIKMFPNGKFSDAVKEKIAQEQFGDKIKMLHVVLPREEYKRDALLARNLPVSDVWYEIDTKQRVSEGGFHEFPFIIPRWDTTSGESMGRSPGMIALPDANTLQAMGETLLVAGQRAADPPLMAPNDGSFSEVNSFPGGLSYYDIESAAAVSGNPFFPLETGSNIPLTREMQQDMREQVYMAFYRHIFNLPVERPEMTAYEVRARKEELIREIGPVMGRLEADDTAPTVERSFALNLRAGRLPPIPDALQGQRVSFEYESPIKRIREQAEAVEAALWAQNQFLRSQFRPEAADIVDVDELGRFEHEAAGLPMRIIASKESLEALREQRAEAEQAQSQMAAMEMGGKVANDAAGALQKVMG